MVAIDNWLESDKDKPKKQRHTAHRIYNRLVDEHDYKGGESTVRRYVRLARVILGIEIPRVFIPCNPEAGKEAEVDWGHRDGDHCRRRAQAEVFLHAQ